jgi:biotin synthase-like enzyme
MPLPELTDPSFGVDPPASPARKGVESADGGRLSQPEALAVLDTPDEDLEPLLDAAHAIRRHHYRDLVASVS